MIDDLALSRKRIKKRNHATACHCSMSVVLLCTYMPTLNRGKKAANKAFRQFFRQTDIADNDIYNH